MRSEYDLAERFVASSLRGYRIWQVAGLKLTAVQSTSLVWDHGKNYAICSKNMSFANMLGEHFSLGPHFFDVNCTCGFYAKYSPYDIAGLMSYIATISAVAGAVKATGKVVQGTKGYRAQYAEIEAICPILTLDFPVGNTTYQALVKRIASEYGVPFYKNMEDLLVDFPPEENPIPQELLDEAEETRRKHELLKKIASENLLNEKNLGAILNASNITFTYENGKLTITPTPTYYTSNTGNTTVSYPPNFYLNINGA